MRDYITLGTAPTGEPCVQLSDDDYHNKTRTEANRFRELLLNKFGTPPGNAYYKLKSFPHDYGTYHELCIMFDDDNEQEVEFAYMLENELPEYWE